MQAVEAEDSASERDWGDVAYHKESSLESKAADGKGTEAEQEYDHGAGLPDLTGERYLCREGSPAQNTCPSQRSTWWTSTRMAIADGGDVETWAANAEMALALQWEQPVLQFRRPVLEKQHMCSETPGIATPVLVQPQREIGPSGSDGAIGQIQFYVTDPSGL